MATEAEPRWTGRGRTRKRRRNKTPDPERLKILRLDLNTIMEQIKLLDLELEQDPCLSAQTISDVLTLVAALKQQLEQVRRHIRELKAATAA